MNEEEIIQQDKIRDTDIEGHMKTYYAKSMTKGIGGKDMYHVDAINYSPEGQYVDSHSYDVWTKSERDAIIQKSKNTGMISTKQFKSSYDTHKEPLKEKRPISMKKYLEQLEKDKITQQR